MQLRLKGKIWLFLLSIILIFSYFLFFYFPEKQQEYLKQNYELEIQKLANTVATGVELALNKNDFKAEESTLNFVKNDKRFRFICMVQKDSVLNESNKVDFIQDTLCRDADLIKIGQHWYQSNEESIVKSAFFMTPTGNGQIILCFSTDEIRKTMHDIRITSLLISSLILLASLLIGFLLPRTITIPLYELRDAAVKVGLGDYTQQVKKTGGDEIGELGKAFNKMVTDLATSQAQLVQSEKMASLGQLTAGVAHEINNPINFVSANISPLKRNYEELVDFVLKKKEVNEKELNYNIAESKQLFRGIEEGAHRTTEIVKGLRNFSRLDEGVRKKADLNEGIESTLVLLRNKLEQHSIELVKSLGDIPEIKCYPGQINQVFMNILTNAIDSVGENGKIFITTSAEDNKLKISIRDTGKGMNDEVKKKIFDPFFTTKDVGKGTGLGLSISYGIIENHKGKIEVLSEVGKGSEFVISLPS